MKINKNNEVINQNKNIHIFEFFTKNLFLFSKFILFLFFEKIDKNSYKYLLNKYFVYSREL
jgi:hypothetical protein